MSATTIAARADVVAAAPDAVPGRRIFSLDVIRGAVMVLMALDHVRVYLSNAGVDPTDLSRASAPLFLTRWVTHFCAPAFLFLAGTGAFLYGRRAGTRADLARWLLVRGAWLVIVELTIVRLGWTFNLDWGTYLLGGVIWMIGWCMILLADLSFLPLPAIAAIGLALILGHNILDYVLPARIEAIRASEWSWLWQILYLGGPIRLGEEGPVLAILFSVVPWVGVMAAGYAFGAVMTLPPQRRDRLCFAIGAAAIALFIALRAGNLYGDTRPWSTQASPLMSALSFVNTNKYPASLLFLLMTLGPTIALIPLVERTRDPASRALAVFGRVPFFYYVLHIPLIHLVALGLSVAAYGTVIPWMTANHPLMPGRPPEGYGYGLGVVWLVTALVTVALYFPCRWFARQKAARRGWGWSLL